MMHPCWASGWRIWTAERWTSFGGGALPVDGFRRTRWDGSDGDPMEMLRLREGQYLRRAEVLLFHPDPARFFAGAFVKIGYFRTETDLAYQDVIEGNLFAQVDRTVDLLCTKYSRAAISYEGIYRRETPPTPVEALREAVLNAVAHRDYTQFRADSDSGTRPPHCVVEPGLASPGLDAGQAHGHPRFRSPQPGRRQCPLPCGHGGGMGTGNRQHRERVQVSGHGEAAVDTGARWTAAGVCVHPVRPRNA